MRPPRAAVLGAGVAGLAASRLLADQGFQVTIFDQHAHPLPEDEGEGEAIRFTVDPSAGALAQAVVDLAPEFVVASPGIPPSSPLLRQPAACGLPVFGEVELAWRFGEGEVGVGVSPSSAKWLAVTGTNGKTTTVGMVESILQVAGINAVQAGNVGYPITRAVAEDREVLVAELSSFQLAETFTLEPWASICLNVDADHLDWHGGASAYRAAKGRVYNGTRRARFFFEDDPDTAAMAQEATGAEHSALVPLAFGEVGPGEIGVHQGVLVDRVFTPESEPNLVDLRSVPQLAAALRGPGDGPLVRDALAAAALALSVGTRPEHVLTGLRRFQVAPHRFAVVPTADGITWIDDSKATNGHAAVAALENVQAGTAVWIVGGDSKGQSLRPIVEQVAGRLRGAVIIGAEQSQLREDFAQVAPELPVVAVPGVGEATNWMREVVRACQALAVAGDTVLLAPACASWDQFTSYSQRGDVFAKAVVDTV